MKKALALALCAIGFMPIAAPAAVDAFIWFRVFLNGKPLGNAVSVQGGIIAVSLEDFARAGGSGPTLEPNFRLQGNTLLGVAPAGATMTIKMDDKAPPGAATQYKPQAANTPLEHLKIKMAPGQLFRVQKPGPISTRVFMVNGKAYVPLEDVARAFGGVFNQRAGTLKPGQDIQLNFTPNTNAMIGWDI